MSIENKVIKVIRDEFCPYPMVEVSPDSHLADDLGADSLDMAEMCMAIEAEFNIEIPDETFTGWECVGDVIETVENLL